MINEERICSEFAELVQIDAPGFGERRMADALKEKLTALGFEVQEDRAGEQYGSDTGNLYGYLKGGVQGEPVLLSAHLDTVRPALGKKAVFHKNGRITGSGDTVLGADDVAGIVEILEGIRHLQEEKKPFRDVEVLLTIAEESYIKGAKAFDFGRIRAREAYVLDMEGAPGSAALRAPSLISFKVTVAGKASHAGFAPEEGIHAIQVMSAAISRIRQGYVDGKRDTTLNIGMIQGGTSANIVPGRCVCEGEIRSFRHEKALKQVEKLQKLFEDAAQKVGADVRLEFDVALTAYETSSAAPAVIRFGEACRKLGLPGTLLGTFGGSDNNQFALQGIRGIVLSCGMHEVHSVREYTTVEELKQGAALVAELLLEK